MPEDALKAELAGASHEKISAFGGKIVAASGAAIMTLFIFSSPG